MRSFRREVILWLFKVVKPRIRKYIECYILLSYFKILENWVENTKNTFLVRK